MPPQTQNEQSKHLLRNKPKKDDNNEAELYSLKILKSR